MRKIILFTLILHLTLKLNAEVSLGTVIVNADSDRYSAGEVINEELSSFSNSIKKENFEKTSETLPELIQKEAGVQVRQSGGLGSFSSLSLRGASSNQVMVFIDGVPMNDSSGSGVDISSISLSDVESIEIYKGITPINFGKASIGGAINIKTKKATERVKAKIITSYGSFNSFRIAPSINQKISKFDYAVDLEYQGSKNNFIYLNDNGTKWNPNDDKWEHRNNNQFNQYNLSLKTGYDISSKDRLVFTNQYFNKDQHLPSWDNNPATRTTFSTLRNLSSLKWTSNNIGNLNINSSSRFDYLYKKEIYDDRYKDIGLEAVYSKYRTIFFGLNQFFELAYGFQTFSLVADIRNEDYKTTDLLGVKSYDPSSRLYFSMGLEDKINLINNSLTLVPALSFEHYGNTFKGSLTRTENNNYINPKFGIKYSPLGWLKIKTNIGRYVREPSFFELFGDRGLFVGNENLKAEKGVNFDIGIEANIENNFSISLSHFRNNVTDVISYIYNARGVGQAVNISNSSINGIEAILGFNILRTLYISSNYTWQSAMNKSQITAFNNKKLPGRFKNSVSNKAELKYYIFKTYYEFLYADGLFYDSANLLPAKIKREQNIGVSATINAFTLTGEIKNLANNYYQDFNGYPKPGRSYWLTLNYDI